MKKFWQVRNAADNPAAGELLIYGLIGSDAGMGWLFDETTPKQFREDLDSLGDIDELRLFINSEGGDVFAGQAIHSMLRRHPANVTVHVDGLAASIAAVVSMAGDRVIMPRNAMMMIHNPWTIGVGDAQEFREVANTLDSIRESIIAAFQAKTEMPRDELIDLLDAETWMTAQEAVDMGFADEIAETKSVSASLITPDRILVQGIEMDLSGFRNRPKLGESNPKLSLDEHRAQLHQLAQTLAPRWQDLAADGPLSNSRQERLRADVTALEDVTSALRELLPVAETAHDEFALLAIEHELTKARLNGVAI